MSKSHFLTLLLVSDPSLFSILKLSKFALLSTVYCFQLTYIKTKLKQSLVIAIENFTCQNTAYKDEHCLTPTRKLSVTPK